MTIVDAINQINRSDLSNECKAYLYTVLNELVEEMEGEEMEGEEIWMMPNSEWRGLPMSRIPLSYLKASLIENTPSYIRAFTYRKQVLDELMRRREVPYED